MFLSGVICTLKMIMLPKTFFQILRTAGVIRMVCTFKDIHVTFHNYPFWAVVELVETTSRWLNLSKRPPLTYKIIKSG
jgi:hypothetical protein